ncbi:hypothetical protein KY284_006590 [Solanum tuberosum]|nr:hypothetical protein KY284_006590 [Solanum tuberosum]
MGRVMHVFIFVNKKPTKKKSSAEKAPTTATEKSKSGKKLPKDATRDKKIKGLKNYVNTYKIYIFKVLKQVHPDIEIASKAMGIMNNFINDIFERLAEEFSRLSRYNRKPTITFRVIQSSLQLVLPSELAKHIVSEGTKGGCQIH